MISCSRRNLKKFLAATSTLPSAGGRRGANVLEQPNKSWLGLHPSVAGCSRTHHHYHNNSPFSTRPLAGDSGVVVKASEAKVPTEEKALLPLRAAQVRGNSKGYRFYGKSRFNRGGGGGGGGGGIVHYLSNWEIVTNDPFFLDIVKGLKIDFLQEPPQKKEFNPTFSKAQK